MFSFTFTFSPLKKTEPGGMRKIQITALTLVQIHAPCVPPKVPYFHKVRTSSHGHTPRCSQEDPRCSRALRDNRNSHGKQKKKEFCATIPREYVHPERDRQTDRDREEILIVHPCCRDEKEQMKKLRDVVEMLDKDGREGFLCYGGAVGALFLREHHQGFFRNWNRTLVLSFSALVIVVVLSHSDTL